MKNLEQSQFDAENREADARATLIALVICSTIVGFIGFAVGLLIGRCM